MRSFIFRPALVEALRHYQRQTFISDISAGITVGVVALPLAMAFAIASGVKPEAGLFTAIIAGFLISALGGSRVQIGGPTGAFIVVVYSILERYGLGNLLIATMLAGILLFAMGICKLGNVIRFIPIAVIIGFTNGIAVLIVLSQIKDFLGLQIAHIPADFFGVVQALWQAHHTAQLSTIVLSSLCLALLFLWPTLTRRLARQAWGNLLGRVPGPLLVLLLATSAVIFFDLPVATIGSRFGGIPDQLPSLQFPALSWNKLQQLLSPALTIALLAAIESLLCARISDSLTGQRHNPNQELMAQGIANLVTPWFGGIPAAGTIARTVTNIRYGARTPIAGITHALTLLLIILMAAPLAKNIPLCALAAILLHIALNMGEWREFMKLRHFTIQYRLIMLATFMLTILLDITVAVEVGTILACIFFIYRIAQVTRIEAVPQTLWPIQTSHDANVEVYRIFGSLFFGTVSKLESLLAQSDFPKFIIFDTQQMVHIDSTGLDALETLVAHLHKHHCHLLLCHLNQQPAGLLQRSGFIQRIGKQAIFTDLVSALAHTQQLYKTDDRAKQ